MIDVGVGVLMHGPRYFLARRPRGKARSGLWEFPGGKREPGEPMWQCVAREFREEFGVTARVAQGEVLSWTWAYPDGEFRMHAHVCQLADGSPGPRALEDQGLAWSSLRGLVHYEWAPSGWPLVVYLLAREAGEYSWPLTAHFLAREVARNAC